MGLLPPNENKLSGPGRATWRSLLRRPSSHTAPHRRAAWVRWSARLGALDEKPAARTAGPRQSAIEEPTGRPESIVPEATIELKKVRLQHGGSWGKKSPRPSGDAVKAGTATTDGVRGNLRTFTRPPKTRLTKPSSAAPGWTERAPCARAGVRWSGWLGVISDN